MNEKYKPPVSEALMATAMAFPAGSWTPADFMEGAGITAGHGIGDVNSDARGSGARYNAGKAAMELLPLLAVAALLERRADTAHRGSLRIAIGYLGEFQSRKGDDHDALGLAFSSVAEAASMSVPELVEASARVFDYGRRKYAEWNWAKGMPWSVPLACAMRHILGSSEHQGMWDNPEGLDPESGLPIAGHVGCNILMLAQYLRTYREGDDRPKALEELPF